MIALNACWEKLLADEPEFAALCETYAVRSPAQAREFLDVLATLSEPLLPSLLALGGVAESLARLRVISASLDDQPPKPNPRPDDRVGGVAIPKEGNDQ